MTHNDIRTAFLEEMLKIAPVQVAVERISEPNHATQESDSIPGDDTDDSRE